MSGQWVAGRNLKCSLQAVKDLFGHQLVNVEGSLYRSQNVEPFFEVLEWAIPVSHHPLC
jgi:hypothetical protein